MTHGESNFQFSEQLSGWHSSFIWKSSSKNLQVRCFINYFVSIIVSTKITPTKLKVFFESYDVVWSFPNKKQDKGITPPPRFKRFFCVLNVGTVVEGKQSGFPLHWIHVDGWTGREDKPTQCPMKLSERNKLLLPEENETRSFCSQRNRYLKIYLPEICSAKRWFHYKTATKRFSVSVGGNETISEISWVFDVTCKKSPFWSMNVE